MANPGKDLPAKSQNPKGGHSDEPPERKKEERTKSSRAAGTAEKDYKTVKVLILTFKFNDLELEDETKGVNEAFDEAGYVVEEPYEIEMDKSLDKLKTRLRNFLPDNKVEDTLYIIYYHGHGGIIREETKNRKGKPKWTHTLSLRSHNWPDEVGMLWETIFGFSESGKSFGQLHQHLRDKDNKFQKIAEIPWKPISRIIMKALCDTLVILDCCEAGMAAVTSQQPNGLSDKHGDPINYRKELIGACGWRTSTGAHMSPALCDTIKTSLGKEDSSISTSSLVRLMNNYLVSHMDESAPQAVHYILQRNSKDKMILPRLEG